MMTEQTLLAERIAALNALQVEVTPQGRRLDPCARGGLAAAIETEIAETQLPRRLTFSNDAGDSVAVAVAAGQRIGKGSEKQPEEFARLVEDAAAVFVLSEPVSAPLSEPPERSCTTASALHSLADFVAALPPTARFAHVTGDAVLSQTPDAEVLITMGQAELSESDPAADSCLIYGASAQVTDYLFFGRRRDEVVVACLPWQTLSVVQSLWNDAGSSTATDDAV